MNKTLAILKHEFITTVTRKGFIAMAIIFPLIGFAAIGIFQLTQAVSKPSEDLDIPKIGFIDETDGFSNYAGNYGDIELVPYTDPDSATKDLVTEEIDDAYEGIPYSFTIVARDNDKSDQLSFSSLNLPGWLSITNLGNRKAQLTGEPAHSDVGTSTITIDIEDGSPGVFESFDLTLVVQMATLDDQLLNSNDITIYPNPASAILSIDLSTSDLDILNLEVINSGGIVGCVYFHFFTDSMAVSVPISAKLSAAVLCGHLRLGLLNKMLIKKSSTDFVAIDPSALIAASHTASSFSFNAKPCKNEKYPSPPISAIALTASGFAS